MTKLVTLKAAGRKMIFQDCKANGLQLSEKETWDLSRGGWLAASLEFIFSTRTERTLQNWRPKPEKSIWEILEFLTGLDMKPDPSSSISNGFP